MRELTEQEIKYRNQKCNELCPSGIDMVIGFDNGFIAGIEYQQAEVEQLRTACERAIAMLETVGYEGSPTHQMLCECLSQKVTA